MSDVFYLRPKEPPITAKGLTDMLELSASCFNMHRVDWKKSFMAQDGSALLCWYEAPDAESVRIALKTLGADVSLVWPGSPVHKNSVDSPESVEINFLAKVEFDSPYSPKSIMESFSSIQNEEANLHFVQGFISRDGLKVILLFNTDNPALARSTLLDIGYDPVESWPCSTFSPPSDPVFTHSE